MKVASLEAYGAHRDLLAAWEREYGAELLPIQERAVLDGQVLNGVSVVGSGPTGCGKTFIGEMAAVHAATQGRRVFYLTPTKALAEALYAQFVRMYAPLGLRVEVSTQDRRGADRRIARGEFDLAVTVPEKLWAMVQASPALVGTVGALVVDELQLVGDPDRGPCLELLMARFLQSGETQIVGLSAVLSNGQELAHWLRARLVEDRQRPVELRKGVWQGGVFEYLEHNGGRSGTEEMPAAVEEEARPLEAITALAVELASRGEPTLVFVRDRLSSVRAAQLAARVLQCPPAERALEALRELPRTQATMTLAETLQCGVAFHNADLHFAERQVVEEAFSSDEALCLIATSTLAVGVNLPARNVIVDPVRWQVGSGAPSLAALSRSDFENMAGRAGRLGFGDPFGRAILMGSSEFDSDALRRRYLEAPPEPVVGRIGELPELAQFVLTASLYDTGHRQAGMVPLLTKLMPQEGARSEEVVEFAVANGMALRSGAGGLPQLTGLGRAAAASGLSMETVTTIAAHLRTLGRAPTNLEALILASLAAEARAVPLPAAPRERAWMQALAQCAQEVWGWTESACQILWSGALRAAEREMAARIALLVLEWTGRASSAELEVRTGVHAGRAQALCEAVGWVVQCEARFAAELAADLTDVERLQEYGEAIAAVLPTDCLPLGRLRTPSLQRDHILALAAAGLTTPDEVLAASPDTLRPLLPPRVLEELRAAGGGRCDNAGETIKGPAAGGVSADAAGPPEPVLILDPGRPDRVIVNGREIPLRPMEFQLLALLARQPRRCVSFDRVYEELWGSGEPVEPQQIHWHRHHLARKLAAGLPRAKEIVRTIPRRGLILDLPAEQVRAA